MAGRDWRKKKEKIYRDLIELIIRIAGYILKDQEEAREKNSQGDVMGGKVLELESDKLIQEGVKRGLMQGQLRLGAGNRQECTNIASQRKDSGGSC